MDLDEDVCLCFHVTRRKLENFLRVEQPIRASQMSDCAGAGTGCGWCVPILERMFAHQNQSSSEDLELPAAAEYAEKRERYIAER